MHMESSSCKINVFWANTAQDYVFTPTVKNFLTNNINRVINTSGSNVSKALFIYYAGNNNNCDPGHLSAMQSIFGSIKVECIEKGKQEEMIDQAECLIFGGGNIQNLGTAFSDTVLASKVWSKVLAGTPTIGINAGAKFLSSGYLKMGTAGCSGFPHPSYFPLLFYPAFDPVNGQNVLKKLFTQQPDLKYILALPTDEEGSGIVLEESKTGMAGGSIDEEGSGIVLEESKTGMAGGSTDSSGGEGGTKPLYIYEADGTGGMKEVSWDMADRDDLPINYMK